MKIKILACVLIALYLSSCATIFKGTSEEVRFSSDPQRAQVYINGSFRGNTPFSLKLEVKKTYTIEFKKEGYEPVAHSITNHVGAGWIILDVLAGLIPVIIDAATGAWYHLDQKYVDVILEKQSILYSQETEVRANKAIVNREGAVLRLHPDSKSVVIKNIPLGATLDVISIVGEWIRVQLPPDRDGMVIEGYIHRSFIRWE